MGYTRSDPGAYTAYATATAHKTVHDYTTKHLLPEFDPKLIKLRESRNSSANPHATPVVAALDVSGSMHHVVEACRRGLGTLFEGVIKRQSVSDPHVMAMAVDDMEVNAVAALQVTQFEADPVTIGKQIEQLYLVGNGGGNDHESYLAPLYFLATRVDCDAFKENRKGYLFTVGDEEPQLVLPKRCILDYFGDTVERDLTAAELLKMIDPNWHYFHLMVKEGSYMHGHPKRVEKAWAEAIGQRARVLADHTKMSEVIISLIEATNGKDKDEIAASWSGNTALVVAEALHGLPANGTVAGTAPVAL